ncbi:GlsB/YeaQ/YmgE family stress response membrane protein [Ornithobacterium rhinotracheale]
MGFISWIIFGLIAGAIAKAIHPGKDPGGWIATILIGIIGSSVGGWLGSILFNIQNPKDFSFQSFAIAVAGALICLFIYRKITSK